MLRHIVMVAFKADASEEQRAAMRAAVEALPDAIPEIRSLVAGANVGSGPSHFDYVTTMDFDDMSAFRRYIDSPAHQAYVQDHARLVTDKLATIQHTW